MPRVIKVSFWLVWSIIANSKDRRASGTLLSNHMIRGNGRISAAGTYGICPRHIIRCWASHYSPCAMGNIAVAVEAPRAIIWLNLWTYHESDLKVKTMSHFRAATGPTRIWTAIAGFRVQSANRYTIGPFDRDFSQAVLCTIRVWLLFWTFVILAWVDRCGIKMGGIETKAGWF